MSGSDDDATGHESEGSHPVPPRPLAEKAGEESGEACGKDVGLADVLSFDDVVLSCDLKVGGEVALCGSRKLLPIGKRPSHAPRK